MIRTIQYGKVIFRHARNLFDMDPARSGSRLVADTMGTGTCLQEKKLQVSLGSLIQYIFGHAYRRLNFYWSPPLWRNLGDS